MKLVGMLKSRFARESAILQVGGMLNAAGNLLSSVAMAHVLGAREQGDFYTAQAMYAFFFFALNLGVVQATVSQLAAASARGLSEKVANWLAFLAKTYLGAAVLLLGVGWFVLPLVAEDQYGKPELGWWAYWLCLTPLFEMPRVVVCAAFQGTRRMLALAQAENGTEACRVVLVVAGAAISADPLGPILGTLGASLIGSMLAIDMYRSARHDGGPALPGVRDIARRIRGIPLREGLPLGIRVGLLRNIDALSTEVLPTLILRRFAPVGAAELVTYYRISQRIMRLPLMLLQGLTRVALPALSEHAVRGDHVGLRRVFLKATFLGGGVACLAVLAFLAMVPWVTGLFYPADYAAPIFTMSCVLAIALCMQCFHSTFDSFYIVTNRLRVAIVIGLVGGILYLGCLAWFTSMWPVTGPAWALVAGVAYSNLNLIYILGYLRKPRSPALCAPPAGGRQA